jgi:hypothetical protein
MPAVATRTRPAAISKSLPPPVGGLDTRNSLADMPPENSVIMDNWFPETEKVTLRPDHTSHATGMSGAVETIIPYTALTGTGQLFGANNGAIYDVTSAGAIGAAVVSGLTNDRWQQTAIGTAGGQFIHICNGADTPRLYNGTTWSNAAYTGPTLTDVIWTELHQTRVWLGEKDKLSAWYLGTNAITGVATEFSFAGVAKKGGFIQAAHSWSRDSGAGADDVMIFLTSEGEAMVYAGTDPAAASTWALVGKFDIGRPIGRRCMIKAGADVIMLTEDGAVSASSILSTDRSQSERVAITQQINDGFNKEVRSHGDLFGWQPILYPKGQMLIFNVPQSLTTAYQYVFNTLTNKPCRFTGINAASWGLLGDTLYIGDFTGTVHKFDTGAKSDNGVNIEGDIVQAFNYFGSPGTEKRVTMVEPLFQSDGDPSISVEINTDFAVKTASAPFSVPSSVSSGAEWDVADWDVEEWGNQAQVFRGWRGVRGKGRAISLRVRSKSTTARPSLLATNVLMVPGGKI